MQTTVSIPGMHCESCGRLITSVSEDFPAITNVEVDLAAKTITITHGDDLSRSDWIREIEALGDTYRVQQPS